MTKKEKNTYIEQWYKKNQKKIGKKYALWFRTYYPVDEWQAYMADPTTDFQNIGIRPSIKKTINYDRLGAILLQLTYRDRAILDMWSDGMSQCDIASSMGTGQPEISVRIKKIIAYIRDKYNEFYNGSATCK